MKTVPWENVKRAVAQIEHEGLPPEIVEIKQRIAAATRNAEMLHAMFRVIDQSAVQDVVRLKLELDDAYAQLALHS